MRCRCHPHIEARYILEVHHFCSEAPHLTSSTPHPKPDFKKQLEVQSDGESQGLGTQNCHFEKQEWPSYELGLRTPVLEKLLYRRSMTSVVP